MEAAYKYIVFSNIHLPYIHFIWRFFCILGYQNKYEIQKIFEFNIYFSIYHATVDFGGCMAKYVQLKCSTRNFRRAYSFTYRGDFSEMVVSGTVPKCCSTGTSLCSVCIHYDWRYIQKYGCQS